MEANIQYKIGSKVRCYTLIEALVVVAIGMIAVNAMLKMYRHAIVANRAATYAVWDSQQVAILRQRWRATIRNSSASDWELLGDAAFSVLGTTVRQVDGRIEISDGTTSREIRLPIGASVSFDFDRRVGGTSTAYLVLSWPDRRSDGRKTIVVRLAASVQDAGNLNRQDNYREME